MDSREIGLFASALRDRLGLVSFRYEIVGEIVNFTGKFPSGRTFCGEYKPGDFCHLYFQYKSKDPLNDQAIPDVILIQKELGSLLNGLKTVDPKERNEKFEGKMETPYAVLCWAQ